MHRPFLLRRLSTVVALAVALCASAEVSGQAVPRDLQNAVTPLVLILLDNSGSMEFTTQVNLSPVCSGSFDPATETARSRMHVAQEVLTGRFVDFYCTEQSRPVLSSGLDANQGIPHFEAGFTRQFSNGLLDVNRENFNFGLMTFDSFPLTESRLGTNPADVAGMWSYPPSGRSLEADWNIGIRSGLAANGRLIQPMPIDAADANFPNAIIRSDADGGSVENRRAINESIQDEILSIVPYWGTPIAAMLSDARHFLATDRSVCDESTLACGTGDDLYASCRARNVILITDGQPSFECSLPLSDPDRPAYCGQCCESGCNPAVNDPVPSSCASGCENPTGHPDRPGECSVQDQLYPYGSVYDEATALASEANTEVYVVGFALDPSEVTIVDDIADAASGGTRSAFIANNQGELVVQISRILNDILDGTTSRTIAATTTRTANRDSQLEQYEFLASVELDGESPYWDGKLVRDTLVCQDVTVDGVTSRELSVDDSLRVSLSQKLTDRNPVSRTIYTASPGVHSCELHAVSARTSLFEGTTGISTISGQIDTEMTDEEILRACRVDAVPGGGRISSSLSVPDACLDLTDGEVGFSDVFSPLDSALSARCLAEFDTQVLDDHADVLDVDSDPFFVERIVRWVRGYTLSEIRTGWTPSTRPITANLSDLFDDEFLDADPDGDGATNLQEIDRDSRLGDIFHSNPIIVGGPELPLDFPGYLAFQQQAIGVPDTTVADRPTMLYVAANDGMLHAFNAENGDELWSFIPPSILHRLRDGLTSHQILLDGTAVAGDVRVFRNQEDERWRTVLVGVGRGGARTAFALDVTDPFNPEFLWELDAELDPQLGFTYGRPVIGTVFTRESESESPEEVGVALLSGGMPVDGLAQDLATTPEGRQFYVIELESGKVLRRFSKFSDGSRIDAPITGSVAAANAVAGGVVSRAFVGDARGRLLRIDLRDPDPADWEIEVFYDPFASESQPPVAPIYFAPAIAPDARGRMVAVYGFGDVDNFESINETDNKVISVGERISFDGVSGTTSVDAHVNWVLNLQDGEKLTGRPIVFNGIALFPTFLPSSSNICDIGASRVYGIDYIGDQSLTTVAERTGAIPDADTVPDVFLPELREDPGDPASDHVPFWDETQLGSGAIVFGIQVAERPSCVSESVGDGGLQRTVSSMPDSSFELVVHSRTTEDTSGSGGGSGGSGGGTPWTRTVRQDLPRPATSVHITSWGAILD